MKIVFNIISILMVVAVIFLAALNPQIVSNFTIWSVNKIHTAILTFFVAGILTGTFWASSFYLSSRKKLKEYQRKLEKTSVQSTEDSSKVEVLEAKIEVLEKALKFALENK
ncbi:MAG: hypothetical protein WCY19_05895 [Candidatus Gastranaerophilaceae bacterium]